MSLWSLKVYTSLMNTTPLNVGACEEPLLCPCVGLIQTPQVAAPSTVRAYDVPFSIAGNST